MTITEEIIKDTINKKIWQEGCPVHLNHMKLLKIKYQNFEGDVQVGQMMVLGMIADRVVKIFDELFQIKFPIEKIRLINDYSGDDEKSMADNNTSAFNCRMIRNTNRYSNHSMGTAIDINPIQNPYITRETDGSIIVLPKAGVKYLNRKKLEKGVITKEVVNIFANQGFSWGGDWHTLKDYQHFELDKTLQKQLLNSIN
jgi:hypothetical protein